MNQNNNINDDFYNNFTTDDTNNNIDNINTTNETTDFYNSLTDNNSSTNINTLDNNGSTTENNSSDNHPTLKIFKQKSKLFKVFSIIFILFIITTITIIILAELKLIKLPWVEYPKILTLSQNEVTLKKDTTFQFSSNVYPSQVNYGKVIYESSDSSIADINPITGYVSTKKNGVVTIKAYLEDPEGSAFGFHFHGVRPKPKEE